MGNLVRVGEGQENKLSAGRPLLRDLVDIYERTGMDLMGLRFIQMCLLGFAGFLRIEE